MDVLSLFRMIVRHWRVTGPAALVTVIGLAGALQLSSPTYEATGSIVLLSPPEAPDVDASPESAPPQEVGQNPFARYGDLAVVADILVRIMDGDSTRAEFESRGVTGYEVVANRFQRGPVVDVTGQGPSPEAAIRSAGTVLTEVDTTLAELQQAEGADPDYFITSAGLEPPSTATAMYGSTVRAAIAALAVGAFGTLALAVLAEALTRRRAVRTTASTAPLMSDAASVGTEGGASNGSHGVDWSEILSTLRLARGEPSEQGPASQKTAPGEPSEQESASQETAPGEPSKQEPASRKTAPGEPSKEEPATRMTAQNAATEGPTDNGRKRRTTDLSA
jgi:hypothetical protein